MSAIAIIAAFAFGAFGWPWWSTIVLLPVLISGMMRYDRARTMRVLDRLSMIPVLLAPLLLFWWIATLIFQHSR